MKKGSWLKRAIAIGFLTVVLLSILLYKPLGCKALEKATWDYISLQGYAADEIKSVRVNHSYISGLLGYGQWITEVIFEDEPYISYDCVIQGTFRIRVTGFYAAGICGDLPEGYIYMHDTVGQ